MFISIIELLKILPNKDYLPSKDSTTETIQARKFLKMELMDLQLPMLSTVLHVMDGKKYRVIVLLIF